jgi:ACS family hexuronate transporter-like MFS transporter
VLGILSVTLRHSIGWTEARYGYIIATFQVAYAVGLLVAGRLIDRVGTRAG